MELPVDFPLLPYSSTPVCYGDLLAANLSINQMIINNPMGFLNIVAQDAGGRRSQDYGRPIGSSVVEQGAAVSGSQANLSTTSLGFRSN